MMTDNTNYIDFSAKKIMKRLTVFALHKAGYADPDRGKDIFGRVSADSPQAAQFSVMFLQFLLNAMRIWGNTYGKDPKGRPSVFYKKL
jgi:hypothetical protein